MCARTCQCVSVSVFVCGHACVRVCLHIHLHWYLLTVCVKANFVGVRYTQPLCKHLPVCVNVCMCACVLVHIYLHRYLLTVCIKGGFLGLCCVDPVCINLLLNQLLLLLQKVTAALLDGIFQMDLLRLCGFDHFPTSSLRSLGCPHHPCNQLDLKHAHAFKRAQTYRSTCTHACKSAWQQCLVCTARQQAALGIHEWLVYQLTAGHL